MALARLPASRRKHSSVRQLSSGRLVAQRTPGTLSGAKLWTHRGDAEVFSAPQRLSGGRCCSTLRCFYSKCRLEPFGHCALLEILHLEAGQPDSGASRQVLAGGILRPLHSGPAALRERCGGPNQRWERWPAAGQRPALVLAHRGQPRVQPDDGGFVLTEAAVAFWQCTTPGGRDARAPKATGNPPV